MRLSALHIKLQSIDEFHIRQLSQRLRIPEEEVIRRILGKTLMTPAFVHATFPELRPVESANG